MHPATRAALLAVLRTDASICEDHYNAIRNALTWNPQPPKPSPPLPPRIMRREEVAKMFGVTTRAVDGWTRSGILKKLILPGHVRHCGFLESDCVELIQKLKNDQYNDPARAVSIKNK